MGAEAVKDVLGRMDEAGIVGDRTFFNNCISLLASASLHGKASGKDARYHRLPRSRVCKLREPSRMLTDVR